MSPEFGLTAGKTILRRNIRKTPHTPIPDSEPKEIRIGRSRPRVIGNTSLIGIVLLYCAVRDSVLPVCASLRRLNASSAPGMEIGRREFIALLDSAAVAWPVARNSAPA